MWVWGLQGQAVRGRPAAKSLLAGVVIEVVELRILRVPFRGGGLRDRRR